MEQTISDARSLLAQPFLLKSMTTPNRIVMAPMTRFGSPGGVLSPTMADYYQRRAEANVGFIITEGTGIRRAAALNHPNIPRFHGDAELAAWKDVVDRVHRAGSVIAPQLWHVGSVGRPKSRSSDSWADEIIFEGPSGYADAETVGGQAMSEEDVADAIAAFAEGAAAAKLLGFDAVELHGAHGYLIDQFLWGVTNRREDSYGGKDVASRARFAADILRAVRAAVGPDYPVIIRLSQWKQQDYSVKLTESPAELESWLGPLVDAGADMFHCSQRRFWEPEFEGSDLNFAGWAKKLTGLPTITVGSVGLSGEFIAAYDGEASKPADLSRLLERFERGEFDLVAVGRALLQDPHWVDKIFEGRTGELLEFDRDAFRTIY